MQTTAPTTREPLERHQVLTLRAEGAAAAGAGLWLFAQTGQPWWMLAALFLLPDLSFAAYAAGPRIGGIAYNIAHSHVTALALLGAGLLAESAALMLAASVLVFHIGVDRAIGYGLKSLSDFHRTHLTL